MTPPFVKLTLVFPPSVESALSEALIAAPQAPGFTLLRAEGHGSDFLHASTSEQVRGSIERRIVCVVIETAALQPLLQTLKEHVRSPDVMWWSEPVMDYGRLA